MYPTRHSLPAKKRYLFLRYLGGFIVALFLVIAGLLAFPDLILNSYVKVRVCKAIAEAYPGYAIKIGWVHYNFFENMLVCDSVLVSKGDSSVSCSVSKISVGGINRTVLIKGGWLSPDLVSNARGNVRDLVFIYHKGEYDLRCAALSLSIPDSSINIDTLEIHPHGGDDEFFGASKYRRTRFKVLIPSCAITGVECLGFVQSRDYLARSIRLSRPSLSVLVNKDKAGDPSSKPPPMPFGVLTSVREMIRVDSIVITRGSVLYGERIRARKAPASLKLDSLEIEVAGIGNTPEIGDTIILNTTGILQDEGAIQLHMRMPVESPELTYGFSGKVGPMHAVRFNTFLEIAEAKRIKSGDIESAAFDVNIVNGRATGYVRAIYRHFKIVAINNTTGSENGFGDLIISFFANNFKLRTNNEPDKYGKPFDGLVGYTKNDREAFFEFSWFALRSGLKDLIGF